MILEGSADGPALTARPASSGRKRFAVTEGLALVRQQPALRHGLTLSFLVNVLTGAEAPLLVTRLVEDLGLAAQAASGLIAVATLAGVVLAALAARLVRALATRTVMTAAATAIGVAAAGVGATTSIPVLIGAYCVLGASMIAYNVQWRAYRQEVTGGERLGQVSATCRSVAYIGVVIGVAAVSLLQGRGAGTAVLFVGSGLLCVAVVAVLGVLRPGGAEHTQEHPLAPSELREGGR